MPNFVKSIEYVEITLTGSTAVSVNLTKGQTIADCVPFFTVNLTSAVDDTINRRYTEVYFEAGPKITAKRDGSTGTAVVGVFVVEFDTSGNISVQRGTFSMASATSTTEAIAEITTTKAFTVISYRQSSTVDDWDDAQVKVVFNSITELGFARVQGSGNVTGRYYVVATSGTDFSVQHTTINAPAANETTTAVISSITLASSFLVNSFSTEETAGNVLGGSQVGDISDTTHVRCRCSFNSFGGSPSGSNSIATMETQVVSAGGAEFTVERNECDWGDSLTKAVAITQIDQTKAIVIPGGYAGTMNSSETGSGELDGNYGVLDFTSDSEVTGTRATNTSPDGTTMFEVVEFGLAAVTEVRQVFPPMVNNVTGGARGGMGPNV